VRGLIEGGVGIALLEIVRRLSTTQVEIGRHARAEGRAPDVVADVAPGHPTQPPLGLVTSRHFSERFLPLGTFFLRDFFSLELTLSLGFIGSDNRSYVRLRRSSAPSACGERLPTVAPPAAGRGSSSP